MVVCAVKLCRNYTGKNIKPPEGISFHRFPTDADQKEEWIKAIRREPAWAPGTHCRVCSVHFDNSDFKISETGRRILHKDAVPTKNLYQEERQDTVFSFKRKVPKKSRGRPRSEATPGALAACRGCLATNGVLYALDGPLLQTYGDLTSIEVSASDGFPQQVCDSCCAQLYKFAEFRTRCQSAQELLEEAARQHTITTEFIQTIDRQMYNLTLPLSIKKLPTIDVSETDIKQEDLDFTIEEDSMTDMTADDGYDIFDEKSEQKYLETNVKIEEPILDEVNTKIYASVVPKHEIFVEVDPKKILKNESKKRKSKMEKKTKKLKKEKLIKTDKEDIRNTKPRKTDEDYENFAKDYNVDIIFLSREEQIAEVEARKESDNYKNSRFKCDECFKGFTGESAFRNHKAIHDPSVGNYVCEACKFRFPKRYKLLHHQTQHKMNFVCKTCGHISKLASKAMEHFKWHNGVKYPCHYCDRIFIKRTSQFNHMRNRHGSASCDICQEVFSGERGLLAHMQKAHREAVKSRCEGCGVQFHTETALGRHLDTAPGGCGPHVKACAECGDNYPSEELLTDHLKQNHWKEIKCEKCNANFENEKLYRMHRIVHKEVRTRRPRDRDKPKGKQKKPKKPPKIQRRMCEMCGLTWRSSAALKYHQRVHTGEKPHQCPMCPKSFRIQDSLQIHMNTHTGARPFKCAHCPKAFKSRTQNHKHQLVHTKIRRYRCDLCDKTFQTSTCVKTHIRTVHMKIPLPPRVRQRHRPPPVEMERSPHEMYLGMKMDGMEVREPV